MQTIPIYETISFSQLRTQTRRLQALLAADKTVILQKGTRQLATISPIKPTSTPLFLKGFDLGKSKYDFVKRADFYE